MSPYQTNFPVHDDESFRPFWEIVREDEENKLRRRAEAGENVDAEVKAKEFFDDLSDFMREKR